ncbi:glucokinase [Parvularcula lutaonensis]|uniref:Glucokinase n=1 Tax=Parvularcula lutaonensis TaxID=491923 RepID=A0ABV7M837_9PROT|nr:glucokinase [Parvularcula lutaonensis]GGY43748.1 glucokinase [Parvularcula lutaonensis]
MADGELLVGDIGGTNARFAISCPDGSLRDVQVLAVADHKNFDDVLRAYVDQLDKVPKTLCVASAGAIKGDTIHLTNAPWSLGENALATQFGFSAVRLINDFQAQARFAGMMPPDAGITLKEGTPMEGAPVLTVGPGTGFGQALFIPGHPPKVIATEGGHRLLPVRNERELRLYERLKKKMGHPPILEDILSGRGIVNIYEAVVLDAGETPEPVEPPAVTKAALEGPGHAREAILWFIDYLACAAADACVCTGARGGVAVSGGIMPRLKDLLPHANFAGTFARPGILRDYLADVPVRLVTDPYAALYGAAAVMRDALRG